jgi:hypothetical protein
VSPDTRARVARPANTWAAASAASRDEPVAAVNSRPRGVRHAAPMRFMVVSYLGDERSCTARAVCLYETRSPRAACLRGPLTFEWCFPRKRMLDASRALADDAADRLRSQVEHGRDPAFGAGCNHPISLATSARRPASISRVIPFLDGGRERSDALWSSAQLGRSGELARRHARLRTEPDVAEGQRGHSAALETPTCPRAPGKVGSPTELTGASGIDDEPR